MFSGDGCRGRSCHSSSSQSQIHMAAECLRVSQVTTLPARGGRCCSRINQLENTHTSARTFTHSPLSHGLIIQKNEITLNSQTAILTQAHKIFLLSFSFYQLIFTLFSVLFVFLGYFFFLLCCKWNRKRQTQLETTESGFPAVYCCCGRTLRKRTQV